jgi:ornithine cyclodeaminase/alanine dehydrogenase
VKWFGVIADNAARGLPEFAPWLILSSTETGLPLAIMDARWLTAVRTAAITAAAASRLAKPGSAAVGFVACGKQADAHLDALLARFPLTRLVACSHTRASAERLVAKARALGLSAETASRPGDAVAGMDIVVTSVPRLSEPTRFLDAAWLAPGAFVSMVDMGFSWDEATLAGVEMFTDAFQPGTRSSRELLNYTGRFAADLGEVVANPTPWRRDAGVRRALVFAGAGIADVAAAAVVYQRAVLA